MGRGQLADDRVNDMRDTAGSELDSERLFAQEHGAVGLMLSMECLRVNQRGRACSRCSSGSR
jgi:hypothetical protein